MTAMFTSVCATIDWSFVLRQLTRFKIHDIVYRYV